MINNQKKLLVLAITFIFPQFLFAYLDPGTGSYILQMIIAVLVGALYVVKSYWYNVKIFFKNLFSKKK